MAFLFAAATAAAVAPSPSSSSSAAVPASDPSSSKDPRKMSFAEMFRHVKRDSCHSSDDWQQEYLSRKRRRNDEEERTRVGQVLTQDVAGMRNGPLQESTSSTCVANNGQAAPIRPPQPRPPFASGQPSTSSTPTGGGAARFPAARGGSQRGGFQGAGAGLPESTRGRSFQATAGGRGGGGGFHVSTGRGGLQGYSRGFRGARGGFTDSSRGCGQVRSM